MSHPPIEVVSFDAAGTLIHLAEPVGVTYSRVAAQHGNPVSPESLEKTFTLVWKRTPLPFSRDGDGNEDPDERSWWKRLVAEVFKESGHEFQEAAAFENFFEDLYDTFERPGTWIADSETSELLFRIGRRHRLVIVSNFDSRLRRILRDLDLLHHFETLFLSCEEKLSKPDPLLFRRVSETLCVPPGAILHVGDDPECDWAGAEAAGFRHFRTGRRGRPLKELAGELSLACP